MNLIHRRFFCTAMLLLWTCVSSQAQLNIVINAGPTLAANTPALNAFQRAAAQWAARISNSVTVTINADLAALGQGIIGSANNVTLQRPYNDIRNLLVASAAAEPDDAIVGFLPTFAQLSAVLPAGKSLNGSARLTKANAKVLGVPNLDQEFGVADAQITFSTAFNFDFDNSNGVTAGTMDFETAAVHEIGHALGFISVVDNINTTLPFPTTFAPTTLDLFRFNIANSPTTQAEFTTFPRNLTPGVDAVTDFVLPTAGLSGTEFRMSTGLVPFGQEATPNGRDGRQASHWKDDLLTGTYIGMFDPTLNFGTVQQITEADFRALDLMGWNIAPIPEPSTYALGAIGLTAIFWLRRQRMKTRSSFSELALAPTNSAVPGSAARQSSPARCE